MERSLETPDLDPLFCDFDFRGSSRVWDFPLSFVKWSETLSPFTYHSLFLLRRGHSVAVVGILVLLWCRSERHSLRIYQTTSLASSPLPGFLIMGDNDTGVTERVLKHIYWSKVTLQYCVSFYWTVECISYMYTCCCC